MADERSIRSGGLPVGIKMMDRPIAGASLNGRLLPQSACDKGFRRRYGLPQTEAWASPAATALASVQPLPWLWRAAGVVR